MDIFNKPPHSVWFILVVSFFVSLVSTFLNKVLVDHNELERKQKEITKHSAWKKRLLEMADTDPKRYKTQYGKYMKKDPSIQAMQRKMSMARLKPTCFTFIPMIVFFYLVRSIYAGPTAVPSCVAIPPMNPVDDLNSVSLLATFSGMLRSEYYSVVGNITINQGFLGFSGFYILCSVTMSAFMQRAFKVSRPQGAGGGSGGMFDTKAQMELPKPQ